MSHALQRIDETREALIGALAERNWEAVGELDLGCRAVIDEVLSEAPVDEDALREKLESLLVVYRQNYLTLFLKDIFYFHSSFIVVFTNYSGIQLPGSRF